MKKRDIDQRLTKAKIRSTVGRLAGDRRFAPLTRRFAQPILTYSANAFRTLARSIIHQQISGKAAASIEKKFISLFAGKKFPTPDDVLRMGVLPLRTAGLSGQKSAYLCDLAKNFDTGAIVPKRFSRMTDDEVTEHIIHVKGIGRWTADMFLIFALNRPNVLPVGDLGIQKGAQIFFRLRALPKPDRLRTLTKPFDGDLTVFSLYMWKLADEAKNVCSP